MSDSFSVEQDLFKDLKEDDKKEIKTRNSKTRQDKSPDIKRTKLFTPLN